MRGIVLVGLASLALSAVGAEAPTFTRAYPLAATEGVFAYSRISPDGRYLAYAAMTYDTSRPRPQGAENLYAPPGTLTNPGTVTVVDLTNRKVLFTERGIDAYWSLDGERIIYSGPSVSIWHRETGAITRNAAPNNLGDYYSWAVRDGKNLILTISSNYYYLDGDKAVTPAAHVAACPGIGTGDRPLISKDGRRITTFVRGNIVVRGLTDCENTIDTGIAGQKADFSYDGRYIAFHTQRPGTKHYDIDVVDLEKRTVRNVTASLAGSSLFPNFTRDGRLSFRYDSPEYRGFMFASNILSVPATPLPKPGGALPIDRSWRDIFPMSAAPSSAYTIVLIWSSWSAHSPMALADMQRARAFFRDERFDVNVQTAAEPGSLDADVDRLISASHVDLPAIQITPEGLALTEGRNQMPTTLVFHGDRLIDRRLGAQTFDELRDWLVAVGAKRGTTAQVADPKFDPARDAAQDIKAALAEAVRTHRRVILDVGGEWCGWCHTLDRYFVEHADLKALRDKSYVWLKVNYSPDNKNEALLSRYPRINGYPHLFVLDADGKLLQSQDTSPLEEGSSYNFDRMKAFLTQWAPK